MHAAAGRAVQRTAPAIGANDRLGLFFVATLGIMGVSGGLAVLIATGAVALPLPPLGLVTLGGLAVPVAAMAATAAESGSAGVRTLLGKLVRWRVHPGWYAAALGGPAVAVLAGFLLSLALGVPLPPPPPISAWLSLPLLALVYGIIAISEEIGWRGYAQPRLQDRFGVLGGAVLLGVLWGLWHLPQWFIPETGHALRWPFPIFVAFTVSLSVLFARLLHGSGGSVLLVALAHMTVNLYPGPWVAAWQLLPEEVRGVYPMIAVTVMLLGAAAVSASEIQLRPNKVQRMPDHA